MCKKIIAIKKSDENSAFRVSVNFFRIPFFSQDIDES